MKKIGFIGVGIMGKSMVRNLKKAGFDLHIYARTKAKVEDVIAEGVTFHDSIADCVKDCEAVITIVGFPQEPPPTSQITARNSGATTSILPLRASYSSPEAMLPATTPLSAPVGAVQ